VRIEPLVFKCKDQELLQELVLAAVNEATRRVDEEMSRQVKDLTGGIPGLMGKIPGLF
jgi:DNA-binding protein YbaB